MIKLLFGVVSVVTSTVAAEAVSLVDRVLVLRLCACGHGPRMHEHYRPGSDCGSCGPHLCARYRYRPFATRRP